MQPGFAISSLRDLEKLSRAVKWQYFEKLVAWIFDQNGFDTRQGVVISTAAGKRQFDVVAEKHGRLFLVDCKKWKGGPQKTAALKSAARKHADRCSLYSAKLREEKSSKKTVPLIVTLLEEQIEEHENVAIVPIMKLDWFLNNSE